MQNLAKTFIGNVEIRAATPHDHGIQDVLFVVVDTSPEKYNSVFYNAVVETAGRIGMRALSIDDNDFHMEMSLPAIWFVGDIEMITLFSIKYKNYIKASMDQETMNAAIRALKDTLLQYTGYYINYIDGLFRLATNCRIILRPDYDALHKIHENGKHRPMPRNIRIDAKTWNRGSIT